MRRRGALAVLVAVAALPASAEAGPPGRWTQVTGVGRPDLATLDASLARTPDGVLHVGWVSAGSVLHSAISKDARRVTRPRAVHAYTEAANDRAVIVSTPEGLRVFFAGLPGGALSTSTSADGGRTWTSAAPVSSGPVQSATGIAAARLGDGRFLTAWGSPGAGFHLGLDPAEPDGELPTGGPIDPGIGVDAVTGDALIASGLLDEEGVWYHAAAGSPVQIPRSRAFQLRHPVGVTGRIGAPGVFVAYTLGSNEFLGRAAVWNASARKGIVVGRQGDLLVSIAAAPGGRLWLFWARRRPATVYATRSNPAATSFGRVVRVDAPRGAQMIHELTGEGSLGPLDVLLLAEARGGTANWHQRVLPGLSLRARPRRGGLVTFTATDAAEPVRGVSVSVASGGTAKRTGRSGQVTFKLGAGRHRATARKSGYSPASVGVRVR